MMTKPFVRIPLAPITDGFRYWDQKTADAERVYFDLGASAAKHLADQLRQRAQQAGYPQDIIDAIGVYRHEDSVFVGIDPERTDLHEKAWRLEYGDLQQPPVGVLRTTLEEHKREIDSMFEADAVRRFRGDEHAT